MIFDKLWRESLPEYANLIHMYGKTEDDNSAEAQLHHPSISSQTGNLNLKQPGVNREHHPEVKELVLQVFADNNYTTSVRVVA